MKKIKKILAIALIALTMMAAAMPALASVGWGNYLGTEGSTYNIRYGQNNNRVYNLQVMLIHLGYLARGENDGVFGDKTLKAVKDFQKAKGLTQDGIVGVATKQALWAACGYSAPSGCIQLF